MGVCVEFVSAAQAAFCCSATAILGSRLAGGKAERAPVPRGCVPAAWMAGPCSNQYGLCKDCLNMLSASVRHCAWIAYGGAREYGRGRRPSVW